MPKKTRMLLADTNILDALLKADLMALLDVLSADLGVELCVLDRVFAELTAMWDEALAAHPAVAILRTVDDLGLEASIRRERVRRRSLSETDAAQLCLAKARGLTLWTNDGPLFEAAREDGVEATRLFGPVAEAVRVGALPVRLANLLLANERANNPWFSEAAARAVEAALAAAAKR